MTGELFWMGWGWSSFWIYTIRIIASTIIGGIIGYDRGKSGKNAGIKTHAMVCLGSCLVSCMGGLLALYYGGNIDVMSRLCSSVVSGIGFLGAGVILTTHDNRVKGLTTAAGLWFSACIGIAIGSDFWWLAVAATLCFFIITHLFPLFEDKGRIQTDNSRIDEDDKVDN